MINGKIWSLFDWHWPGDRGPGAFSWWHFMWLGFCIVLTFCLVFFVARKHNKKYDMIVCRVFASILVVLETIKIVNMTIYRDCFFISELPYQFCSLPIYLLAIASFFKDLDNKWSNTCVKLASYFGLVGGLAVMVYPEATLNTNQIYYSIHTMLWHGLLVAYSIYYFASLDIGKDFKKDIIPSSIGFIGLTMFAVMLNEVLYPTYYLNYGIYLPSKDEINYFWLASRFNTEYPILSSIKKYAGFECFILSFIVVVIGIFIMFHYVAKLIKYHKPKDKIKEDTTSTNIELEVKSQNNAMTYKSKFNVVFILVSAMLVILALTRFLFLVSNNGLW